MPLPRNLKSKNHKGTSQNKAARTAKSSAALLDTILEKNNIKLITARKCKFIGADGKITDVILNKVLSNMKLSICVVFADKINPTENISDLYQIEHDKISRGMSNTQDLPETATVEQLIQHNFAAEKSSRFSSASVKIINTISKKNKLELMPNIRYVELMPAISNMVIMPVRVYSMVLATGSHKHIYVIQGDLQTKSSAIKLIDSEYEMEHVANEQMEFMERVKNINDNIDADDADQIENIDADSIDTIDTADTVEMV